MPAAVVTSVKVTKAGAGTGASAHDIVKRAPAAARRTGKGSGKDIQDLPCSWICCRSLLSSGWSWRYGPVIVCDASSALNRT